MFIPSLLTAPSGDVLTLAELKSSLRITHTFEDALLQRYINAAVDRLDGYYGILGKALLSQTWQVSLPSLSSKISLPFGNKVSAVVVKYYDSLNSLQTASSSLYLYYDTVTGPIIELTSGSVWPQVYDRPDPALVQWTFGFGSGSIPSAIKEAVALLASNFYENRAVTDIQGFKDLPPAAQALLSPYSSVPI